MEQFLFELLQIAIGNRKELTRRLSADEWASLRLFFKKQALLGIGYCGIVKLPQDQTPPIQVLAQWVHNAEKIRKKNKKATETCVGVCQLLEHDGFNCCILKGQSNLVNYHTADETSFSTTNSTNRPNLTDFRTPGDVDVLCWPKGEIEIAEGDEKSAHYVMYNGHRAVIEYILLQHRASLPSRESAIKYEMPEVQYHHVDWEYDGTPVEVHFRASWLNNPIRNRRLQEWTEEQKTMYPSRYCLPGSSLSPAITEGVGPGSSPLAQAQAESSNIALQASFPIPSTSFNVVYQLLHIYRHLFNEGIGLRQLLDYYFVLRAYQIELGEQEDHPTMAAWEAGIGREVMPISKANYLFRQFGVDKFASAVMWVLEYAFAMPSVYRICEPDEKRGRFLLNEIMLAGNFGKYDERNVISADEGCLKRFVRRQKRFMRFLGQYPSEVIWGPYFTVKQRLWRMWHGWK